MGLGRGEVGWSGSVSCREGVGLGCRERGGVGVKV